MIQFFIRRLELGGVASRAGLQLADIELFSMVSLQVIKIDLYLDCNP